jgi:hypothetical protein
VPSDHKSNAGFIFEFSDVPSEPIKLRVSIGFLHVQKVTSKDIPALLASLTVILGFLHNANPALGGVRPIKPALIDSNVAHPGSEQTSQVARRACDEL